MEKNLPNLKSQKGQVILIVLLVLSVVLVVGLSVASRSVTDIKISQQTQESARALWVAQAGLEKAMKANLGVGATTLGGVQYSVVKTDISGGLEYIFPAPVDKSETATLWLVEHDPATGLIKLPLNNYNGNKLTFYWGNYDSGEDTALEATLIYEQGGSYKVKRYVYDPNTSRSPPTNFTGSVSTVGCSCKGETFAYCSAEESLPGGAKPYLVRLRLIFNASLQIVGIKGDKDFFGQGSCFESTANVPESGVTRKLRQCQEWQITPGIFDFGLFSGTSIQ